MIGMGRGKRIQVELHPDGTITGKTIGMKGTSCLSALELLEALVDATVTDSEFTAEFYEREDTLQETQAQGIELDEVSVVGD